VASRARRAEVVAALEGAGSRVRECAIDTDGVRVSFPTQESHARSVQANSNVGARP
jgi:hypothetical protein